MPFDGHVNLGITAVATAPSPALSGTSLVITAGHGATRVPAVLPANATIWPANSSPDLSNAEIVRITARSTDTLTITRTQEGTSARSIVVGDQLMFAPTVQTLTDIETVVEAVDGNFSPTDVGLVASNYDPLMTTGQTAVPANGTLYVQRFRIDRPVTASNIIVQVGTAGATLTADQCSAVIYDNGGSLLTNSSVGNQATNWQSTGVKTMAMAASQALTSGYYWVALWANGTTRPAFARSQGVLSCSNGVLAAASARFGTADTGITTTAPSTLGTRILTVATPYWVGLS